MVVPVTLIISILYVDVKEKRSGTFDCEVVAGRRPRPRPFDLIVGLARRQPHKSERSNTKRSFQTHDTQELV